MEWKICLIIAFFVFVLSISATFILRKVRNSFSILLGGVLIAVYFLFLPIYSQTFLHESFGTVKTILIALHNTLRLFIMDGEFTIISDYTNQLQGAGAIYYSLFAAVLFVLAPILTFGVVLSFFKNFVSYISYLMHYFTETYIFSEINEKSLTLAKSIKGNGKKRTIIFAGITEDLIQEQDEFVEEAKQIGALLFKKEITLYNFAWHSKKSKLFFFMTNENETENITQALDIIDKYRERENTELYVFASNLESELLLTSVKEGHMKIRRVNEIQALINRLLYDEGIRIFEHAAPIESHQKSISAVVIGMGRHGTQMLKSLPWFCQMDGYRVEINAFDMDGTAEERFCYQCPELMDEIHNGDFSTDGEAHYKITIHAGVDIESKRFWDILSELPQSTYVFVALGNDEKNIRMAAMLRSWFEKQEAMPLIDAVVYDSQKKELLSDVKNYSGQAYRIHFVGDRTSSYSEDVILDSDVEEVALERHLKWGKEEEFWKYEYNYRSSIASAIHRKMKIACGISGTEKAPEERNEDEKWALRKLEHQRWNAYMRSEGYVWAEKRNNLAKTHPCLVPFEKLSLKEQEKDDD